MAIHIVSILCSCKCYFALASANHDNQPTHITEITNPIK